MAFESLNKNNMNRYQKITPQEIKEKMFSASQPRQINIPKQTNMNGLFSNLNREQLQKNVRNQINLKRDLK